MTVWKVTYCTIVQSCWFFLLANSSSVTISWFFYTSVSVFSSWFLLSCTLFSDQPCILLSFYFSFVLFLGGHPPLCVTFSVRMSVCLSVCRAPYPRNRTSSNHNIWYTCVKWSYIQPFFSFFWNFDFLGCYGGKRAKNCPTQNQK